MSDPQVSNWILDSWRGKVPAYKVFWFYAVPTSSAFLISGVIAGYLAASYPSVSLLILVLGPLFLVFTLWFCVSLWRCAFNTSWVGWGYISRAWVLLTAIGTLMQLSDIATLVTAG